MPKKKNNQTVINNIGSVNMEIDYDKLAEAIVKAQAKAEKQKEIQELQNEKESDKLSVRETFKIIGAIITNKAKSNGTLTSVFIGGIMSLFFNFFAICGICLLILDIYAIIVTVKNFSWTFNTAIANIFSIIIFFIAGIVISIISFIFRAIANEIKKEKDRNYIIAVFSAIVAFVALVLSFMDVIKEVI